jgi:hypothetical protein
MLVHVGLLGFVGWFPVTMGVCGLCGGGGSLVFGLWEVLVGVAVWWGVVHWVGLGLVLLGGRVLVRVV